MSGVIDEHGQQWEHCHTCSDFVKFPQNLGYTEGHKAHICLKCANNLSQAELEKVIPAPSWIAKYDDEFSSADQDITVLVEAEATPS